MLGVDNVESDLDVLVATFDCLFDRDMFFGRLESVLKKSEKEIKNIFIVKGAIVPLARFDIFGVKVDLVFADMLTPAIDCVYQLEDPEYLLLESSLK
jgi:poly(A) polymerase Pap1